MFNNITTAYFFLSKNISCHTKFYLQCVSSVKTEEDNYSWKNRYGILWFKISSIFIYFYLFFFSSKLQSLKKRSIIEQSPTYKDFCDLSYFIECLIFADWFNYLLLLLCLSLISKKNAWSYTEMTFILHHWKLWMMENPEWTIFVWNKTPVHLFTCIYNLYIYKMIKQICNLNWQVNIILESMYFIISSILAENIFLTIISIFLA